jgi:hypothetical protein
MACRGEGGRGGEGFRGEQGNEVGGGRRRRRALQVGDKGGEVMEEGFSACQTGT